MLLEQFVGRDQQCCGAENDKTGLAEAPGKDKTEKSGCMQKKAGYYKRQDCAGRGGLAGRILPDHFRDPARKEH